MSFWKLPHIAFFSIGVFFHNHSRITGLQGKGEGIYLTPHHHFHPLHRHLDISRAITAESSPLDIGSSRTRTGNLWFPTRPTRHYSNINGKEIKDSFHLTSQHQIYPLVDTHLILFYHRILEHCYIRYCPFTI